MNLRNVFVTLALAVALVSAQSQTPQPGTSTPAPTTLAPVPTTTQPGATTPAPTTAAPGPTTAAPGPTTAAPGPTTAAPGPTTAAPGPTTAAPTSKPTPAPTTMAPTSKPTPAVTTVAPTSKPAVTPAVTKPANCREVSVEGDATYCIQGPICSGKGDKPAGASCPVIGDVAVKHCLKKLKSYTQAGNCVAPVNAVCKKIKTGAWGCVWDLNSTGKPTPAPTNQGTPAPTPAATKPNPDQTTLAPSAGKPTPAPTTGKPNPGQSTPTPTTGNPNPGPTTAAPISQNPASQSNGKSFAANATVPTTDGTSTGTIAIAVVGTVAAVAIVGAVVYTRKNRQPKETTLPEHIDVVTP